MDDYQPPDSGMMQERQNDEWSLRLLLAQRRLYSRAKRWQGARWLGILVLGVGAPFLTLLIPEAAVLAGAVAGGWLFAGRTILTWLETRDMLRAACLQEEVDHHIFNMPTTISRAERPTPEQVALLSSTGPELRRVAERENLMDWYPIEAASPGAVTVAIAQRSNAAYTDQLIRTTLTLWSVAIIAWLAFLITWASVTGASLADFLLGVAFPLLPAFLDVTEYVLSTWRASKDRADLARTIGERLRRASVPIEGQELLVWQERLFDLRRTTPQVPDWLYRLVRRRNERAMHTAARQLRGEAGLRES